jgi:hypothetical protein
LTGRRSEFRLTLEALVAAMLLVFILTCITGGAQHPAEEATPAAELTSSDAGGLATTMPPVGGNAPGNQDAPQFPIGDEAGRPYHVEQITPRILEDGSVSIYFTLRNSQRRVIAANGTVEIEIIETQSGRELYSRKEIVAKSDFSLETIGRGAFKRQTLLYRFPPIAPDDFALRPSKE